MRNKAKPINLSINISDQIYICNNNIENFDKYYKVLRFFTNSYIEDSNHIPTLDEAFVFYRMVESINDLRSTIKVISRNNHSRNYYKEHPLLSFMDIHNHVFKNMCAIEGKRYLSSTKTGKWLLSTLGYWNYSVILMYYTMNKIKKRLYREGHNLIGSMGYSFFPYHMRRGNVNYFIVTGKTNKLLKETLHNIEVKLMARRSPYREIYERRLEYEKTKNNIDNNRTLIDHIRKHSNQETAMYKTMESYFVKGEVPPYMLSRKATRHMMKVFLSHYHAIAHYEIFGSLPLRPYISPQSNVRRRDRFFELIPHNPFTSVYK